MPPIPIRAPCTSCVAPMWYRCPAAAISDSKISQHGAGQPVAVWANPGMSPAAARPPRCNPGGPSADRDRIWSASPGRRPPAVLRPDQDRLADRRETVGQGRWCGWRSRQRRPGSIRRNILTTRYAPTYRTDAADPTLLHRGGAGLPSSRRSLAQQSHRAAVPAGTGKAVASLARRKRAPQGADALHEHHLPRYPSYGCRIHVPDRLTHSFPPNHLRPVPHNLRGLTQSGFRAWSQVDAQIRDVRA